MRLNQEKTLALLTQPWPGFVQIHVRCRAVPVGCCVFQASVLSSFRSFDRAPTPPAFATPAAARRIG